MKRMLWLGLSALIPLAAWGANSDMTYPEPDLRQKMLDNLDVIRTHFETGYAPRAWKLKHNGWYLTGAIQEAQAKVEALPEVTLKEYHAIVRDFFNATRDYHVGVRFLSTEMAFLPFDVVHVDGSYLIVSIDRDRLSPTSFPFEEGDEIVSFGGRPVAEVVADIMAEQTGGAHELTDRALSCFFLTFRFGAAGMNVPKGPVTVGVKRKGAERTRAVQLMWEYYSEEVSMPATDTTWANGMYLASQNRWIPKDRPRREIPERPVFQQRVNLPHPELFDKHFVLPLWETMHGALHERKVQRADNPYMLGSRESMLPELGKIWWRSDAFSTFQANIFKTAGGRLIGFIRIPHYSSWGWEAFEFGEILEHMEESTDALIIDQMNNPGGSVFYCYALASMLADKPMYTPRHRMAITPQDYLWAKMDLEFLEQIQSEAEAHWVLGEHLGGYPVTYQMIQFFKDYCRFIIGEWEQGHTVTSPYFLLGVDQINPHPEYNYSKPILLLTNELDFSGGDFFPAILQDNERVRILGARTAGAGGYVNGGGFFNGLGLAGFSYTASLAHRIDGQPIEDLGVTPDVDYHVTQDDIQNEFKGFKEAILKEVM
ncbi:MAG: protease-like activity factor CPAF, partial [Chlamydiia bacterium]|nr:protease-like activity factor CPAF [Chlamydiia bacterium]